jgi:endonuclease/exonuclease/phosphatase family metal-dependent hydrolase
MGVSGSVPVRLRRTAPRSLAAAAGVCAALAAACLPFVGRDPQLRVLVFNIHAGKDAGGADNLAGVAALVHEVRADLVLLQEVDRGTKRSGHVDQLGALMEATGYDGAFGRTLDYDGGEYGIAALARERIGPSLTLPLPVAPVQARAGGSYEPRGVLLATALTRRGRVSLANTHLDASASDTYRRQEVEELLLRVRGRAVDGPPLVVGGDFNAEPGTAVIARLLAAGLRDAWAECGSGDGFTYPAATPIKRIDYLFLGSGVRCTEARVIDTRVSDHRPLLVILEPAAATSAGSAQSRR